MRQVIMILGSDSRTALPLEDTLRRRLHRSSRRRSGRGPVSLTMLQPHMLPIRKRRQRLFGTPSAALRCDAWTSKHRGVSSSITP
jgi:hypothetical protein